jgi:adenine-specific DNA methylase
MSDEYDSTDDLKPLAIEGQLPLKAVGIENLKEANPKHLPPHRYLHPWFARRPTPASRLATLASVLPKGTDSDDLLDWMQIGPSEGVEDETISEYVERKKAIEDERSGNLESHYGYPRPFTSSPRGVDREELHDTIRKHWDGELPEILDPTAGGGVIPFESLRYGLPTKANELNPVPSVILKAMLEYAPEVGSLREEIEHWSEEIDELAQNRLSDYFPSENPRQSVDAYICTHAIKCPTCGSHLPLVSKWSIRTRKSADTVISKPILEEGGGITYECIVEPDDEDLEDFDHTDGTISRGGDAECLSCGVITESETVQERFSEGDFEIDIYCVRYLSQDGDYGFRAPNSEDLSALDDASERINSEFELATLLDSEVPKGEKTREPREHGITKWREMFTPRQLISHYEYLRAFTECKERIRADYNEKTAEAILSLLSLVSGKLIDYNSRLSPWHTGKGYPSNAMGGKHLSTAKSFADINMSVGGMGSYQSAIRKILDSYEELTEYLPEDSTSAKITAGDAASLPYEEGSVQSVVIDPPYYSSIMYAELSDPFYIWLREYLEDVHPELFQTELTDKENEAVANPSQFSAVASGDSSKKELANRDYEQKMGDIFSELYRVLEPGGVMTVMFTHKETDAWDTLTMSLINSGFTITSTHPITSEMPARIDTQDSGSADSTLLLVGRKSISDEAVSDEIPSLWSDVKTDTRAAAKEAARDLLDSGVSLTKTDVIISAFGPTLRVFADAYPVVDDEDSEVAPRKALEEAREAVTQVLVEEFLDGEGIDDLDDITKWYVLCWLVHESQTFSYDEGNQLGHGIGVDIDAIKRETKVWRKNRGDIKLRSHDERVQNVNEKPDDRSSRIPVNPDDLSFSRALDGVHAAMHVYDAKGESVCCDWLRERNFDTDSDFKATLKALLQVLPHDHDDWELARDLAVGRTRDVLDLDFSPNVFAEDGEGTTQQGLDDY